MSERGDCEAQFVEVSRCDACGAVHAGRPSQCDACGGLALSVHQLEGRGRLVTWTVVRRPPDAFADQGPMTIGLVDIDNGPRLTARLPELSAATALGARVRVSGYRSGVPCCELE